MAEQIGFVPLATGQAPEQLQEQYFKERGQVVIDEQLRRDATYEQAELDDLYNRVNLMVLENSEKERTKMQPDELKAMFGVEFDRAMSEQMAEKLYKRKKAKEELDFIINTKKVNMASWDYWARFGYGVAGGTTLPEVALEYFVGNALRAGKFLAGASKIKQGIGIGLTSGIISSAITEPTEIKRADIEGEEYGLENFGMHVIGSAIAGEILGLGLGAIVKGVAKGATKIASGVDGKFAKAAGKKAPEEVAKEAVTKTMRAIDQLENGMLVDVEYTPIKPKYKKNRVPVLQAQNYDGPSHLLDVNAQPGYEYKVLKPDQAKGKVFYIHRNHALGGMNGYTFTDKFGEAANDEGMFFPALLKSENMIDGNLQNKQFAESVLKYTKESVHDSIKGKPVKAIIDTLVYKEGGKEALDRVFRDMADKGFDGIIYGDGKSNVAHLFDEVFDDVSPETGLPRSKKATDKIESLSIEDLKKEGFLESIGSMVPMEEIDTLDGFEVDPMFVTNLENMTSYKQYMQFPEAKAMLDVDIKATPDKIADFESSISELDKQMSDMLQSGNKYIKESDISTIKESAKEVDADIEITKRLGSCMGLL